MRFVLMRLLSLIAAIWVSNALNTCIGSEATESVDTIKSSKLPLKPKWAIVVLARTFETDLSSLSRRNLALAKSLKPYSSEHDITSVYFSENKFSPQSMQKIEQEFIGVAAVRFVNTADKGFNAKQRFGYKYMCKFFALDMYEYLKDFDYYLRLDTDCFVKTLNFDILKWAESNQVGYGFALRKIEGHGPTKQVMPVWVQKYADRCAVQPTAVLDQPLTTCFNFYNNFHIGKVSFFLRPDVQHFLTAVNASGHILSDRWGDSTIQAYAVRLFMDPANVVQVPPGFVYMHGSHNMVVSTNGDGSESNVPQRLPNWSYSP